VTQPTLPPVPPVPLYDVLRAAIKADQPVALATVIAAPQGQPLGAKLLVRVDQAPLGSLGHSDLDRVVARDAAGELVSGRTSTRHYGPRGEARVTEDGYSVFIESFAPPPQMIIFGAVDFTAALVRAAKVLGYRVIVCDARPVFATHARFPLADEVVNNWPDRFLSERGANLGPRDAVCVLTHDAKFDVPAITAAVKTNVGYIGAMGSRRTTETRNQRLRQVGLTDDQFARVMGPIGIDIGARTPEETAISIVAEIIAVRTGRPVASLRDGNGPIHRNPAEDRSGSPGSSAQHSLLGQ
jgi:xanthine dehydrogenase accessory factor